MLDVENKKQPDPKNSLQVDCASALNFVLQQNSVPLIRQILISSTEIISDSRIVIRSNPECFKEHTIYIANLEANQILALDKPKLMFDTKKLQELSENIKGSIDVVWLTEKEEVLAEQQVEIDLLTVNTWGGNANP